MQEKKGQTNISIKEEEKVMPRKILFSITAVSIVALFSSAAFATLEQILPSSSYYDGSTFYDEDLGEFGRLSGRIDFAVYDTETFTDEFIGDDGFEAPGDRQYIYAYQIFNDDEFSEAAVNYFAIFGIDSRLITESSIIGLDSQNDTQDDFPTEEGVAPSDGYFDDIESKIVWKFEDGYIEAGDHSWMLVFSSDQSWVEGDYEIKGVENPFPVAPISNPEPATLLLLATGGGLLLTKRNKLKGRGK